MGHDEIVSVFDKASERDGSGPHAFDLSFDGQGRAAYRDGIPSERDEQPHARAFAAETARAAKSSITEASPSGSSSGGAYA